MERRSVSPWTWQDQLATTLLGVVRLALPGLLVEKEATAAKW